MALSPGFRLGPYELVSPLGRGGMGEVWRARQRKLEREVAIKVLPEELRTDKERLARFEREARLASSLNHPNIVTIHDIAEQSGILYIAMELVAGTTLRDLLTAGPLPVSRAVAIAIQIADGLAKAHAAGVVHRDLKPENLMVTPDGLAKILDFGIARSLSPAALLRDASMTDSSTMIQARTAGIAGTPRYMSPEQLAQAPLDARSDQFAFGIVLYEMLAGKPPFDGPSLASIITAISYDPPPPLAGHRRDLPRDLAKLVGRCLAKRPEERFESMGAVVGELRAIETRRAARGRLLIGRRAAVTSLLALAGLGGIASWAWFRGAEKRWAANVAPAEIAQLIEAGDLFDAYRTARRAKASVADPKLDALLERFTLPISIVTDPPGASVSMKDYGAPDTPWELLGTTPLELQIPYAIARIRIEKQGYETFEGAPFSASTIGMLVRGLVLEPRGTRPAGTVRVPGGPSRTELARLTAIEGPAIPQFWLDRLEVSNSAFKTFVDAGGYTDASLWTEGVSGERFRDPTGRPGPATWALGTFPDGTGDHPVGGVSWYEAAAYCRSKGKHLPTVYHWSAAIGQDQLSDILRMSNFDRKGPAPVGRYQGLGAFGTYDMAGNVREWCRNATSEGKRYALGGDWNDPPYAFRHLYALDPMERPPSTGIRCAAWREQPPAPLFAPVDPAVATLPAPVSKDAFLAYAAIYDYDRSPLEAKIERVDESSPHWRKEVISFRTAYDDERMGALLFLPRNASPPFQTVLWYPGDDASIFRSSERLASPWLFDFLPRSGRALVYPLYDGWYERRGERTMAPNTRRDLLVRRAKDLRRTIDYLETRKDIDASRLAYYGFSAGAIWGPIGTALEPRLRTSILLGGGIPAAEMRPEIHPALFAPHSATPTLMISGEHDFLLPYETSQKPLFDLLGCPPEAKRLARLSGGHIPSDTHAIMREVLDWLDAHLGRVRTR